LVFLDVKKHEKLINTFRLEELSDNDELTPTLNSLREEDCKVDSVKLLKFLYRYNCYFIRRFDTFRFRPSSYTTNKVLIYILGIKNPI